MFIMTVEGWKQLIPPTVNEVWELVTFDEKIRKYVPDSNGVLMKTGTRPGLPTPQAERGGYAGEIPSKQIVEYYNSLKEKMKFFDDGVRMVYGRPDRVVEVEIANVNHPIPYPPPQFKLVNGQWILKRSKYE